jgi:hypothetical protein
MSNIEIEDVLSSIRRLVSDDLRDDPSRVPFKGHRHHGVDTAAAVDLTQVPLSDEDGKLLLTPALRVGERGRSDSAEHVPPGREARGDMAVLWALNAADDERAEEAPAASLEETIAELEAAVALIDDEFEPEAGEPQATGDAGAPPAWDGPGFSIDEIADQAVPATEASPEGASAPEATGGDDKNPASNAPLHPGARLHLSAAERPSAAAAEGEQARGTWDNVAGDAEVDPIPAADEPESDDAAAHRAPPEIIRAGSHGVADAAPAIDDAAAAAVMAIPPDELRAMVVEILRQELQGSFGERVTRSIRKLVRREIHRILESRPLE